MAFRIVAVAMPVYWVLMIVLNALWFNAVAVACGQVCGRFSERHELVFGGAIAYAVVGLVVTAGVRTGRFRAVVAAFFTHLIAMCVFGFTSETARRGPDPELWNGVLLVLGLAILGLLLSLLITPTMPGEDRV